MRYSLEEYELMKNKVKSNFKGTIPKNDFNSITFHIRPFPAVRVNSKGGRFTPRAKEYHEKMNILRNMIGEYKEEIIKLLLKGDYYIKFIFKVPESRKKQDLIGKPYIIKPDNDNCFKAFTDTIFYGTKYNDSGIWRSNYEKIYGEKDMIIFGKKQFV